MKLIDSEPIDECHTINTFKCEICGNVVKVRIQHGRFEEGE
ncbi:MAG: hypothetical protein KAT49_07660 [Methanomicrobia archaeon]|nr:hypothetical protein [Methanomicrobia archaeon]